jgi:hypothetical protein
MVNKSHNITLPAAPSPDSSARLQAAVAGLSETVKPNFTTSSCRAKL